MPDLYRRARKLKRMADQCGLKRANRRTLQFRLWTSIARNPLGGVISHADFRYTLKAMGLGR